MTTLKITCDSVSESLLVRCDLALAAAPVEVNYLVDDCGWESTQFQCADAHHTINGLAAIGRQLLSGALHDINDGLKTEYEVVDRE
jgi:hypothetical protein